MKAALLVFLLFQSVQDIYKSANADFEAGKWNDAAAKYEQILKEDPTHTVSRFNLAVCYSKAGRTEEAITAYRTLLNQNSGVFEAHVNLALLLEETGSRVAAGEEYEKALALHPDDAALELNIAMFYLRDNESDQAYPHLKRIVEKGSAPAEVYAALGQIEHARKNESASREYLRKAIEADPKNMAFVHELTASYLDEKDYRDAAPLLEKLAQADPSNAEYFYLLGKSYEQLKAYPQALANLQHAVAMKPGYFEAYAAISSVYYAQQDWARAAEALTKFIELRPQEALAHFVLATCLDKLGNAREALVHYNRFLELDDGSNDARSFQARERAKALERVLRR